MIQADIKTGEHKDSVHSAFVRLLSNHPDIFKQYPDLLELVNLGDSRGTASLLEKQIEALKNRIAQIVSEQSDFFELARENESISENIAGITGKLIGYENYSEFASEFPAALRATFDIDEVSIKTYFSVAPRADEKSAYDNALNRLQEKQPVCDNRWPQEVMSLFFGESIKSAALIPMQDPNSHEIIGVLALGDNDDQRYSNDLGTSHLRLLGQMTGICIHRLQPKE